MLYSNFVDSCLIYWYLHLYKSSCIGPLLEAKSRKSESIKVYISIINCYRLCYIYIRVYSVVYVYLLLLQYMPTHTVRWLLIMLTGHDCALHHGFSEFSIIPIIAIMPSHITLYYYYTRILIYATLRWPEWMTIRSFRLFIKVITRLIMVAIFMKLNRLVFVNLFVQ